MNLLVISVPKLSKSIPIRLVVENPYIAGFGPSTQHGGDPVRTIEGLIVLAEEIVYFAGGQGFVDVAPREHGSDPLELAPPEVHAQTT